ncbi:hypothetical protein ABHN11_31135 [Brevibacillus centrosporus]|jgi:hypothetical protein|uniref:hypothetical protein n=1 Tax=Brevibacillus centrosporus TaxID=54910 RepID=UPI0039860867
MFEEMNVPNARITFNDLVHINPKVPLVEQLDNLKEDLFQAEVDKDFIVDVGYYPEFSPTGEFKVRLIKNYDWENPVWGESCKEIAWIPLLIQAAIRKATIIKD